jgi:hypothetical protein
MTRRNASLLVVTGGIAGKLEHFHSQTLENGRKENGSSGTNTIAMAAFAQETMQMANRERKIINSGLGGFPLDSFLHRQQLE